MDSLEFCNCLLKIGFHKSESGKYKFNEISLRVFNNNFNYICNGTWIGTFKISDNHLTYFTKKLRKYKLKKILE